MPSCNTSCQQIEVCHSLNWVCCQAQTSSASMTTPPSSWRTRAAAANVFSLMSCHSVRQKCTRAQLGKHVAAVGGLLAHSAYLLRCRRPAPSDQEVSVAGHFSHVSCLPTAACSSLDAFIYGGHAVHLETQTLMWRLPRSLGGDTLKDLCRTHLHLQLFLAGSIKMSCAGCRAHSGAVQCAASM